MNNFCAVNSSPKNTSLLVVFAGRGQSCNSIAMEYEELELQDTTIVGISNNWFPAPQGPDDQDACVAGLEAALPKALSIIDVMINNLGLSSNRVALSGFSAGGCLALRLGAEYPKFAGVVCHSGCIYSSDTFPINDSEMPILLTHSRSDSVFSWRDRYLPTKYILKSKCYGPKVFEKDKGGHVCTTLDRMAAGSFLAPLLGYNSWTHTNSEALKHVENRLKD